VYVNGGTFTKSGRGGIIYGSNAPKGQANKALAGHAVYVEGGEKRDTPAREATAMDSTKSGLENGWE
jgi:hypothetical protein